MGFVFFTDIQQVWTTRRTLLRSWGGSKFNYNIGSPASALIGRTERGFDSLGYHFGPEGLSIAQKTLDNFVERAIRLYEQEPGEPCNSPPAWGVRKALGKMGRGGTRE